MGQTNDNELQDSIEKFLYIVVMTLLLIIFPIFEKIDTSRWTKTIIALIIIFISYYIIKITANYLKGKITLKSFKAKLLPTYIIYFLIYFTIRITLKI